MGLDSKCYRDSPKPPTGSATEKGIGGHLHCTQTYRQRFGMYDACLDTEFPKEAGRVDPSQC